MLCGAHCLLLTQLKSVVALPGERLEGWAGGDTYQPAAQRGQDHMVDDEGSASELLIFKFLFVFLKPLAVNFLIKRGIFPKQSQC